MEFNIAAFFTAVDAVAGFSGFTGHNAWGGFVLNVGWVEPLAATLPAILKDLPDVRITHEKHLPSSRGDLPLGRWQRRLDGHK